MSAKRAMESDRVVVWSSGEGTPMFMVVKQADGKNAKPGNGNMIALATDSNDKVDSLYAKAIALGGSDESKQGHRRAPSRKA